MIYDAAEDELDCSDDDAGYAHSDPLTFDSWASDVEVREPVITTDLPKWLTDLRDGIETPPPRAGMARQQRLAAMDREITDCRNFITGCDYYKEFLNQFEWTHGDPTVPIMMGRHLEEMRTKAASRRQQLEAELAILRRQG